jgi:hypothetical protein
MQRESADDEIERPVSKGHKVGVRGCAHAAELLQKEESGLDSDDISDPHSGR